jgi:hypothetical protein
MKPFTSAFAAFLVAAGVSAAAAQAPDTIPAPQAAPRVEFGGGITVGMPLSTDSEGFGALAMAHARAGVALNSRWTLEAAFDIWPESSGSTAVYRAQARWQITSHAAPDSLRTHLTFGAAGAIEHDSYPATHWQDASGRTYGYPARSSWSASPPMLPAIGLGVQKTLGAHLALRADLTAIIVPFDDGVAVLLMPSVSLSFPIGRYPSSPRR